jgi:hypothetical protein
VKQVVSVTVLVEVESDHPSPRVVEAEGKKRLEAILRGHPGVAITAWMWLRKQSN